MRRFCLISSMTSGAFPAETPAIMAAKENWPSRIAIGNIRYAMHSLRLRATGFPKNNDYNGASQAGAGYYLVSMIIVHQRSRKITDEKL